MQWKRLTGRMFVDWEAEPGVGGPSDKVHVRRKVFQPAVDDRSMGMTYIGVRVSKGRRSPPRNLRLLVDTGSDYTVLPAALLARLGVKPEFDEEVEIGNGDVIVRPVGRVHLRWRDRWAETFVAFGEPKDARVLGALTLQELRLVVDPKSHRVLPRKRALFLRIGG